MAKYVLWTADAKWKPEGGGFLWRETYNECVLRGMMWADNYWQFCENKERFMCMVNDIIAELLDLDMEPKP